MAPSSAPFRLLSHSYRHTISPSSLSSARILYLHSMYINVSTLCGLVVEEAEEHACEQDRSWAVHAREPAHFLLQTPHARPASDRRETFAACWRPPLSTHADTRVSVC
eukprot:256540-Rhodomonas_salina.1